jgi:hypothetical protein
MTPWTEADYREFFEERAAIAEHDGGLTAEQAEQQAMNEMLQLMQQHRENQP